jgi:hypothetical protein
MNSVIKQIQDLKTEAKNQRDRGIRGYARALKSLENALAAASACLAETTVSDVARDAAKELADCHGMMGGIQRRWALEGPEVERRTHLASSCKAYDSGYGYEWNETYKIYASYNLTNRLFGRVLIDPDLLRKDETVDLGDAIPPLNVPHELSEAEARINLHLANKGNFWAEADLALLRILRQKMEVPLAYAPFVALSPPDYAYSSALDGLRPLAELPIADAPMLQAAMDFLEKRRPQSE